MLSSALPYKVQGTQKDPLEEKDIKLWCWTISVLMKTMLTLITLVKKNLKGEDGVGVEENGCQPEGVEVVEPGKHNLLVDVEPVYKSFCRLGKLGENLKYVKNLIVENPTGGGC